MAFELWQGGVEAVADGGLEQATEALDRVEFGAVGRQPKKPDVLGDARITLRQAEAGLVGDDDMERVRLDRADLAEEKRVHVAVDDRGEEQLAVVCAVHFRGLVEIAGASWR